MLQDTSKAAALESTSRAAGGKGKKAERDPIGKLAIDNVLEDVRIDTRHFLRTHRRHGLDILHAQTSKAKKTLLNLADGTTQDPRFRTVMYANMYTSGKPLRTSGDKALLERIEHERAEVLKRRIEIERRHKKALAKLQKKPATKKKVKIRKDKKKKKK